MEKEKDRDDKSANVDDSIKKENGSSMKKVSGAGGIGNLITVLTITSQKTPDLILQDTLSLA